MAIFLKKIFIFKNLNLNKIILNKIKLSFILKNQKEKKSPKGKIRLYAEDYKLDKIVIVIAIVIILEMAIWLPFNLCNWHNTNRFLRSYLFLYFI